VSGVGSGRTDLEGLKRLGWSLTTDDKLRECGHKIPADKIRAARAVLDLTVKCRRKWLCPTCGDIGADIRSSELGRRMVGWTRKSHGHAVALLTLTQGHRRGDRLDDLWDRLEEGRSAITRGSGRVLARAAPSRGARLRDRP
jgi:hypothetical protein